VGGGRDVRAEPSFHLARHRETGMEKINDHASSDDRRCAIVLIGAAADNVHARDSLDRCQAVVWPWWG